MLHKLKIAAQSHVKYRNRLLVLQQAQETYPCSSKYYYQAIELQRLKSMALHIWSKRVPPASIWPSAIVKRLDDLMSNDNTSKAL